MRSPWSNKTAVAIGLATAVSALFLGCPNNAAADILPAPDPAKVPVMTLKIYNNDTKYNIYPVLTTGNSPTSLFLQAFFKIKADDLPNNPFPKGVYRFYINPTGTGIPPGKHVFVTVPLLTQLVAGSQINSKKPQLINWWEGGRFEIFDAPVAAGQPPLALRKLVGRQSDWTSQKPVRTPADVSRPMCVKDGDDDPGNNVCPDDGTISLFSDTVQFLNNEPSQTFEFTLGAKNDVRDPGPNDPAFTLNTNNLDIDVSYVDIAYLPGAMAPFNPALPRIAQSGYIGSVQPIDDFRDVLKRFIKEEVDKSVPRPPRFGAWPQYRDRQGTVITKIASPLHAAAGDSLLIRTNWSGIDRIRAKWDDCTDTDTDKTQLCTNMRAVKKMFLANHEYYFQGYRTTAGCDQEKDPVKLDPDGNLLFSHVQGFTPFTENCPADAFQLYNTPGYADQKDRKGVVIKLGFFHTVKSWFDDMQYDKDFNPYVFMVHDKSWADIPNSYAYSVDDAVGNLQADGKGFIIAIGGTKGLPNPSPATSPIIVGFGFAKKDRVKFIRYGVCTQNPRTPVNPDFPAFAVDLGDQFRKCLFSFVDNNGEKYFFRLNTLAPFKMLPPTDANKPILHQAIDCSDNPAGSPGANWCNPPGGAFAYSEANPGRGPPINHVIFGAPPQ